VVERFIACAREVKEPEREEVELIDGQGRAPSARKSQQAYAVHRLCTRGGEAAGPFCEIRRFMGDVSSCAGFRTPG
jgi:hypothetical protein